MIQDYNLHMLGVDKLDQMMSYYSFLHKSVRKVFFRILEVAVTNAYILYKQLALKQGQCPMSHLAFRHHLMNSLSEPLRSSAVPRARAGPHAPQNIERLHAVQHYMQKGEKTRDCMVCSNREEGGTRHLTLYYCSTCPNKPPLCPSGCFESYHTHKRYRQ